MSISTVPSAAGGSGVSAGYWNTYVRDNLNGLLQFFPFLTGGLGTAAGAMRIVGIVNGAPPSGAAFLAGDVAFDLTGSCWLCSIGGNPGTWVSLGAPTGTIYAWPNPNISAPINHLLCDGAAQLRTTYARLYTALGGNTSPWGQGDGSTTFNTPDLRGRVIVGVDASGVHVSGVTTVGLTGGEQNHVLSIAELATHAHPISDPTHVHSFETYIQSNLNFSGGFTGQNHQATTGTAPAATGISVLNTGGNGGHNTMQPYDSMNYIIKV